MITSLCGSLTGVCALVPKVADDALGCIKQSLARGGRACSWPSAQRSGPRAFSVWWWHKDRLPKAVMESPSLELPKSHLDMVLGSQLWVSLLEPGGLDKVTATGFFPHQPCHDFDSALVSVESSLLQFLCDINSLLPVPLILLQQCFLWIEPWAVF